MAKSSKKTSLPDKARETIAFEYIKSQFFRVIHADGAIGSITPTGDLHIAFYSERPAIPKMTVHPLNEDGTLGDAISEQTVTRGSIIREMDVDVVIDPSAIDGLVEWLLAQKNTNLTSGVGENNKIGKRDGSRVKH